MVAGQGVARSAAQNRNGHAKLEMRKDGQHHGAIEIVNADVIAVEIEMPHRAKRWLRANPQWPRPSSKRAYPLNHATNNNDHRAKGATGMAVVRGITRRRNRKPQSKNAQQWNKQREKKPQRNRVAGAAAVAVTVEVARNASNTSRPQQRAWAHYPAWALLLS